jgi:hypothetical protein
MRMVTLKHLRYFEALSRLRHFGRAAEECAIKHVRPFIDASAFWGRNGQLAQCKPHNR